MSAEDCAIEAATAKAMAMVAIEMILTLGHQLGKGFDLGAYAETIAEAGRDPETPAIDRRARESVAAMLVQLSQASAR
ncbi:MAG: hypothetical protein JWL96_2846 [Sphingomonas bacterium]|jgi:hypothetical protein|uniref:hypothetical protein n=1 Tax=Sphingomonas bacterium TaxID=1895847 RepID=UPI0026214291|nr:hypothetical protein [Sphingomonas bacterium]MDB5710776.1 hypothetical protein [Sphingomonas bacterium]